MAIIIPKSKGPYDPDDAAGASAVRSKVETLLKEREGIKSKLNANTTALLNAVAAGQLFGVEIELPPDLRRASTGAAQVAIQGGQATGTIRQASLFEAKNPETTIRDLVLDTLKAYGEKGAKAATLRRVAESTLHRQLHFKTIGMTLYRLSKEDPPKVRREGIIWHAL